ncbi:ABC transporter permease [Pseudoalteromonas neustonica]|uniref:ABC transporter permease n=1 Tax=Pseudoalteromonas neustonica TaxID=1840331 RepID=A0ABU9U1E6_9GAMM
MQYFLQTAWQNLKQKPLLNTSFVLTVGLTLAVLICVITLAYNVILKPLPYPEQSSLYKIEQQQIKQNGAIDNSAFTYPGVLDIYNNQSEFGVAALNYYDEAIISSLPNQPKVFVSYVTPQWFDLLGWKMHLGSPLSVINDTTALEQQRPQAVISYQFWQQHFAANTDVIGKTLSVGGSHFSVSGVLDEFAHEPQMHRPSQTREVWLPFSYNPRKDQTQSWAGISPMIAMLAKLNTNIDPAQLALKLAQRANQLWLPQVTERAFLKGWQLNMQVTPLHTVILGDSKTILQVLIAASVGLLLIALTNVANLLLAKYQLQSHTIAIHHVVGAKTQHIYMRNLVDIVTLLIIASCLALVLAQLALMLIKAQFGEFLPRVNELALGWVSYFTVVLFVVFTGVILAKVSTPHLSYGQLQSQLSGSGKGQSSQINNVKRQVFIVLQITFASVLMFASTLVINDALKKVNQPLGFAVADRYSLSVEAVGAQPISREQSKEFVQATVKALNSLAGVEVVSRARSPFAHHWGWPINDVKRQERYTSFINLADEHSFSLLDLPLLSGRNFNYQELVDGDSGIVINQSFAHYLSPEGNAVGTRITPTQREFTVIGVVADKHLPNIDGERFVMYQASNPGALNFLIKTKAGQTNTEQTNTEQTITRQQLLSVLNNIDSRLAISEFISLEQQHAQQLSHSKLALYGAISTAVSALFIAAIGLYGVLSISLQIRLTEIATRMAIGAKPYQVVLLMLFDHAKYLLFGFVSAFTIVLAIVFTKIGIFNLTTASLANPLSAALGGFTLLVITLLTFMTIVLVMQKYVTKPVNQLLTGAQ